VCGPALFEISPWQLFFMLMKFPTRLGNLIFSAEQYRLALKFKFKAFLRNFKQLVRAPAADEVLGLVIVSR
jgi:hypothetical protein